MSKKTTKPELLTIEMPLDGLSSEKLDNLQKLIDSKATLIKKAIGAEELPIQILDNKIAFPWFSPDLPAEEIQAYSQFIAALCDTAKKKVRVVARPQEVFENEKFAMRVFGIGLGLKGAEYLLCRKLMSRNLSGDGSWRYTKPEKGEPRPRRERVQRDVISIRLTPDTLEKLAILAAQKDERTSRNMLIEGIIEGFVSATFPAEEPGETAAPVQVPEASEPALDEA